MEIKLPVSNVKIYAAITGKVTRSYPPHKHSHWEIMYYLKGEGYLYTPERPIDFRPGTMIIVPPGVIHGSVSENGFRNLTVSGDFSRDAVLDVPYVTQDNKNRDGMQLAQMIYNNRYSNKELLLSLCSAYVHFLTRNMPFENNVTAAVNEIISKIDRNAFNCDLNLNALLLESGYAEDYIRSCFRRVTGKTPNEFLTEVRMDRAKYLINIYGENLSVAQVAEQCGYLDPVYFSKKFKNSCGVSPREYRKMVR